VIAGACGLSGCAGHNWSTYYYALPRMPTGSLRPPTMTPDGPETPGAAEPGTVGLPNEPLLDPGRSCPIHGDTIDPDGECWVCDIDDDARFERRCDQ